MGATASSAQRTATMDNPMKNVFLITEEVANRIEGYPPKPRTTIQATSASSPTESFVCKKCAEAEKNVNEEIFLKPKPIATPPQTIYEKKSIEMEKAEFERIANMLDNKIGKPIDWTAEHKEELETMKTDLINCYKDYPREPLRCHKNAKVYQDFVFEKQYKTIMKHKLGGAGDGADSVGVRE